MSDPLSVEPSKPNVVATWRLTVGTSIFLIDVRDDGSWQPSYVAPGRLSGWERHAMPEEPAATDVSEAILAWSQRYGAGPVLRPLPLRPVTIFTPR
ncbi:hypothetical protein [Burkholderia sp. BCC0322]|uniref:hypothetical protein n=1 Tax=unclassified Burkholderia TaxID=2613784 RepID=UPI00158A56A9|nr:hypothetical protein [Burkholderia sp. BCC0322]